MREKLVRQLVHLGLGALRAKVYRQREAANQRAILRAARELTGPELLDALERLRHGGESESGEELLAQELQRMERRVPTYIDPLVDDLLR